MLATAQPQPAHQQQHHQQHGGRHGDGAGMSGYDYSYDQGSMQEPLRAHKQYVKIKDLNRCTAAPCHLMCPCIKHPSPPASLFIPHVMPRAPLSTRHPAADRRRSRTQPQGSQPDALCLEPPDAYCVFLLTPFLCLSSARSGTSGFVQLAYNLQTGEQCAIKFIERGIQMQRIVARELLNHRMCALHPHIVQLKVGACCLLFRLPRENLMLVRDDPALLEEHRPEV